MQTQHQHRKVFDWRKPSSANSIARQYDTRLRSLDSRDSSRQVWDTIIGIPGVRNWRIMRDVAFLLTSLPLGLAAFIVAVTGGTLGVATSFLLVGIPILVWTIGFTLRFAMHERNRLNALLNLDLGEPNYPANNGENVIKHLWTILRSPQVRGDLVYMMLLLPLGIVELALVLLPLEFLMPSLLYPVFGQLGSFGVLGVEIGSLSEAVLFLGLGAVLLMPMLILMNMTTNLHASLAQRLLGRRG